MSPQLKLDIAMLICTALFGIGLSVIPALFILSGNLRRHVAVITWATLITVLISMLYVIVKLN